MRVRTAVVMTAAFLVGCSAPADRIVVEVSSGPIVSLAPIVSAAPSVPQTSVAAPPSTVPKAPEVGYQQQVGTLTLLSAGLDAQPVLEGADAATVDLGVGRLGQSALPGWLSADGSSGEMILLGHRTSKTAPFANLVLATVGDRLLFTDSAGVDHPFVVDDVSVVPFEESLFTPTPDGRQAVRLIACTCAIPDGGAIADAKGGCVSHRIIVSAVASR